jgi:short-subunit dehydrogenase
MKKTILITGTTSGIGEKCAKIFHAHNWRVIATGRSEAKLKILADLGIETFVVDVCKEVDVRLLMSYIIDNKIVIDVLLNNAGYGQFGTIEETSLDLVRAQFETNVFRAIRMLQNIFPLMRQNNAGRIINLSSVAGRMTFPSGGYYSATKFAIEAISDTLRYEVKKFGLKIILIEPGPLHTEFFATVNKKLCTDEHSPYKFINKMYYYLNNPNKIPILKFGYPQGMAKKIFKAATTKHPKNRYVYPLMWYWLKKFYTLCPSKIIDTIIVKLFLEK